MERRAGSIFLAASAIGAARTLNAWHPVSRSGRASVLAFGDGVTISEMPLHTLAWQAALSAGFVKAGALRTGTGRAGLALTAASWAGLVALDRVASEADEVLEAALVDGLGPDYRQRMDATFAPPEHPGITLRQVANPLPRLRRRYATTRDVPYGVHGRRNHLDIWRRADLADDAGAPVLVQVHGGAWTMGSKEYQANPLMGHLAERGWVSVALNYRLSPRSTWPDHIVDVKRALAWVKDHIVEYGGDPDFVVVTGGSAGGHLSSLAALTPNVDAFQPGFEDADTSVRAAVPMYGVYDFTNRDGTGSAGLEALLTKHVFQTTLADEPDAWDQASPMSWIGPDAPPFFLAHGTNDTLVPVEQARSFARMLREVSNQAVVYAELPRAQHAFDLFSSVRTLHTLRAIDRFLAVVRSGTS
ncbi:MAG: alpha/beta hydrolase [Acidimicrobiales bacterium]|nr:alpha/beta hydrolase [Acidimicrobiales bacterium]